MLFRSKIPEPKMTRDTFPPLDVSNKECSQYENYLNWKRECTRIIQTNRMELVRPITRVMDCIMSGIRGITERYLQDYDYQHMDTLEEFFEGIRQYFSDVTVIQEARAMFYACKQGKHEDIRMYIARLRTYFNAAFEEGGRNEGVLIDRFLSGLYDKTISGKITGREGGEPKTIEENIRLAIEFTATQKRQLQVWGQNDALNLVHPKGRDNFNRETKQMKEAQTPGKPSGSGKKEVPATPKKPAAKAAEPPKKKGGKVHTVTVDEDPPKKKEANKPPAQTPTATKPVDVSKMTCNKCGTVGHLAKTCKVKTENKPKSVNQIEMEVYSGDEEDWEDCFMVEEDFQ